MIDFLWGVLTGGMVGAPLGPIETVIIEFPVRGSGRAVRKPRGRTWLRTAQLKRGGSSVTKFPFAFEEMAEGGAIIATWEGEAMLAQVEGGSKFDWRIEAIEIPGHVPEGDPPDRTWKPVTVSLATSHRLYVPILQWLHRERRHELDRVWAAHVHRTDHREYQPEVA